MPENNEPVTPDKAPGADAVPTSPSPASAGAQKGAVPVTPPELEQKHDESVQGGKFRVRGVLVNAHGKRVNDSGERIRPDGTVMTDREMLAELYEQDAIVNQALLASEAK